MITTEEEYLQGYTVKDFEAPLVTVDVCIFTLIEGRLHVLAVQRAGHPFLQRWALPGGFIDLQQDCELESAALRKLKEKTGLAAPYLEQVGTYGNADRDPRGWSVTTLYMALVPHKPVAGFVESVTDARWWSFDNIEEEPFAFDHSQLISIARERLRAKSGYTVLPIHLLQAPFTLTQLQRAFEELLGAPVEKKSFRRRIQAANLLEEVGEALPEGGRGRIAVLYQPKADVQEHAFIRAFGAG